MAIKELAPEPMNGTDAALWDIERDPSLRTTVVSIMQLDRTISERRLLRSLDESSRLMPRLRQRVVEAPLGVGPPSWVVVDDLDVRDHVRYLSHSETVSRDLVLEVATEFAEEPFDRTRPLWEIAYLDGFEDGGAALVIKVHHSFTDGVGGVAMLDVFLDASRRPRRRDSDSLPELRRRRGSDADAPDLAKTVERVVEMERRLGSTAVKALSHPVRTLQSTIAGGSSAVRMLKPSGGALSPLMTERGPGRRLATHVVDLDRLHDAAARHGCTINHLFVSSIIAGAADYHRAHDAELDELRVLMPINFRRKGDGGGGNQWAPVRFRLPADIDDPTERLITIREVTGKLRQERALGFSHSLAGAMQILPSALSSGVVGGMMRGVDIVATNVPGLHEPHFIGGAEVVRLFPFAPTGGAAFNAALMSHGSVACLGLMSDTTAVEDPDDLHERIIAAIDDGLVAAETLPSQRAVVRLDVDHEPERLSALDTSFLRLETPESPMHIGGVFVLDGAALRHDDGHLRVGDIRRHIQARLALLPRFTRRLAEVPLGQGRPLWVEDPEFDIAHHVKFATAIEPGGVEQLYETCCDLDMECLDRSRPLWELWFIDGLESGRIGLVQKVHHALLDGVSSVDFVSTVFDLEPLPDPDLPIRRPVVPPPSPARLVADAWAERLRDPAQLVADAARSLTEAPASVADQVRNVVESGRGLLGPETRAPETWINQPVGRHRVLTSIDLRFDDIDAVRASFDASPNDVALAVLAGGLRRWFERHHEPLDELHAMCPISLRSPGTESDGGNRVGAMLIPLPLAEPDPVRRLAIIHERTTAAKRRHDGEASAALIDAVDHIPAVIPGVAGAALRSFIANQPFVNLVITNVPGPRTPIWFLGAAAESIVPIVPLGPNTALGVALLSYIDHLTIGLHADPDRCPDVDVLREAIHDEIEQLVAAT